MFDYILALLAFALLGIIVNAIKILREYERGVIFQLGRFWKVKGPGLIIVIPVIQQIERVDLLDDRAFFKIAFFNITGYTWDDIDGLDRFDGSAEFHEDGDFFLDHFGYCDIGRRGFDSLFFGLPVTACHQKNDQAQSSKDSGVEFVSILGCGLHTKLPFLF